jgi:hypothetical protein
MHRPLANTPRAAKCYICGKLTDSHPELADFKAKPGRLLDSYNCGCDLWQSILPNDQEKSNKVETGKYSYVFKKSPSK